MKKQLLDVAIIGGGPAGLNAALVLGRARKNVAVIDAGCPRNAVTRKAHGFLTRDGISPSEFRQIAKEQISAYPSVSFIADKAVSITKTGGHFQMTTAQGNFCKQEGAVCRRNEGSAARYSRAGRGLWEERLRLPVL